MPSITFRQPDGRDVAVQFTAGHSVMEVARNAGVEGLWADCGGECACATCHVLLDSRGQKGFPPPESIEDLMLDLVSERQSNSRLSCQLELSDSHDGLVVTVADAQGTG